MIQGLVLLTDIERRRGEVELAERHGALLREIDPDGVLTASYADLRRDAEWDALLAGSHPLVVAEAEPVEAAPVAGDAVASEGRESPVTPGGVRPIGEERLPAAFPTAPDITPAYRPVVTRAEPVDATKEAIDEEPEVVEELAEVEPETVAEEADASESPAWPVSRDRPPGTKLPSSDAIAAMLGLLREERHIKE